MISKDHSKLSVSRQCKLLGLSRSSLYYRGKGESNLNHELMRLMDEHYLDHPYKGAERMHVWLTKDKGYRVNKKRIERLYYDVMGLRSVLPGKHTSVRNKDHKTYPYLLRDLDISKTNEVWAMDITYIPMARGHMYLNAIIDLNSRYVVGWSVSNTMDAQWCVDCLRQAEQQHGHPQIINTDQGSQFTSEEFTGYVLRKDRDTRLSMDGKGRATDNAFIERLWRSVKYEKVYLHLPQDGQELYDMLKDYMSYYNTERRHSSINDQRPSDIYHGLKVAA